VTYVYDDVTYVYDDVTYVYDDVPIHIACESSNCKQIGMRKSSDCQKRPIRMAKEAYLFVKEAYSYGHLRRWRPIHMATKRGLFICLFIWPPKEAYSYTRINKYACTNRPFLQYE
jgi:hypothetical protein